MAVALSGERVGDVCAGLGRLRDRREPELPQLAVRRSGNKRIMVLHRERLQADPSPLEHDRFWGDHSAAIQTLGMSLSTGFVPV